MIVRFLSIRLVGVIFCIFLSFPSLKVQQCEKLKLWYEKLAKQWVEALPVGNGRLRAMVFGDPCKEVIQLNENTVWAGNPPE
jgi:alpha-L-fucosidase 2